MEQKSLSGKTRLFDHSKMYLKSIPLLQFGILTKMLTVKKTGFLWEWEHPLALPWKLAPLPMENL